MAENMNFENFDAVWRRVTETDESFDTDSIPQNAPCGESICLIADNSGSRAVRFLPKF